MPWYKIDLSYGAGHQGHDTTYEYHPEVLTKEWEKEIALEAISNNMYARDSDNSVCWKCNRVEKLPEEVRLKKVQNCKDRIEYANQMLLILEKES
jgi:hypothetical protein